MVPARSRSVTAAAITAAGRLPAWGLLLVVLSAAISPSITQGAAINFTASGYTAGGSRWNNDILDSAPVSVWGTIDGMTPNTSPNSIYSYYSDPAGTLTVSVNGVNTTLNGVQVYIFDNYDDPGLGHKIADEISIQSSGPIEGFSGGILQVNFWAKPDLFDGSALSNLQALNNMVLPAASSNVFGAEIYALGGTPLHSLTAYTYQASATAETAVPLPAAFPAGLILGGVVACWQRSRVAKRR